VDYLATMIFFMICLRSDVDNTHWLLVTMPTCMAITMAKLKIKLAQPLSNHKWIDTSPKIDCALSWLGRLEKCCGESIVVHLIARQIESLISYFILPSFSESHELRYYIL